MHLNSLFMDLNGYSTAESKECAHCFQMWASGNVDCSGEIIAKIIIWVASTTCETQGEEMTLSLERHVCLFQGRCHCCLYWRNLDGAFALFVRTQRQSRFINSDKC